MDSCLHANSYHRPAQKRRIIKILMHRTKTVLDPDHLQKELKHLTTVLSVNGYKSKYIKELSTLEEPIPACLSYINNLTEKIAYLPNRKSIQTIFK